MSTLTELYFKQMEETYTDSSKPEDKLVKDRDLIVAVLIHCGKNRLYKTQISPTYLQVDCMICGKTCDVKVHKILKSEF